MVKRSVFILAILPFILFCQSQRTHNLILITIDGLRWEEVFAGADSLLLRNREFVSDSARLSALFWARDASERRSLLFPFLWGTVAGEGQIHGNRWKESKVNLTNTFRFSYPGYSEILVGYADPRIKSNDKIPNPDVTFLEFLNARDEFHGSIAAFGSWDVFPFIINESRSGIPVNAGYENASDKPLSPREEFLNELQDQIPRRWETVRFDAFTHHYAMEYQKKYRPRVLYIAYGETDDFAHDERYDQYLLSARRTDSFIRMIWEWTQSDPQYRDRTTLLITTDHGRGRGKEWSDHGSSVSGADQVWFAVIGPDTPPLGEVHDNTQYFTNQLAATATHLLGVTYTHELPVGKRINVVVGK